MNFEKLIPKRRQLRNRLAKLDFCRFSNKGTFIISARLDALSKPAKSQKLKNKWSSLSKKSMDGDAEKPERKTGLLAIISGKEGIAPTLSVTDSTSDKRQADLERNDRPSASLVVSRFNKLPPIGR